MENRIEINGVWYVKEDTTEKEIDFPGIPEDPTFFQGVVWEDDRYCFEVHRLTEEDGYASGGDCLIQYTIKVGPKDEWENDMIDSITFMKGLFNRDENSLKAAREEGFSEDFIQNLRNVIAELIKLNWI